MSEGPFSELHAFSIERLIRLAHEHGLITNYRMTPTMVRLHRDDEIVELDPEEARLYLIGLLEAYYRSSGRT